jgi:hypothetical protein
VSDQVLQDLNQIIHYTKMKNATLNYLSQRIKPNQIETLQQALT